MCSQDRKKPRFLFPPFWSASCAEDRSGRPGQSVPASISVMGAQADAILFGQRSSGRAFAARSSQAQTKVIILGASLTGILLNRMLREKQKWPLPDANLAVAV
jgi:hypothetical protein